MATISLTRDIKLTNEDALKILNHKPSKKLQAVLKSIESQDATAPTKNKLIQSICKMTIQVTPLKQYLENIQVLAPDKTEKQVQDLFKTIILENVDFKGNEEMLTYLSDKAPNFEKQHRSRNFIVEETETNNIIGFFSLSLKVVDISDLEKSLKKKLVLKGKSPKNIDYLLCYLSVNSAKTQS